MASNAFRPVRRIYFERFKDSVFWVFCADMLIRILDTRVPSWTNEHLLYIGPGGFACATLGSVAIVRFFSLSFAFDPLLGNSPVLKFVSPNICILCYTSPWSIRHNYEFFQKYCKLWSSLLFLCLVFCHHLCPDILVGGRETEGPTTINTDASSALKAPSL